MAKEGKDPHRCFRIAREDWESFKAACAWNRDVPSVVIRRAVRSYIRSIERRRAEGKEPTGTELPPTRAARP